MNLEDLTEELELLGRFGFTQRPVVIWYDSKPVEVQDVRARSPFIEIQVKLPGIAARLADAVEQGDILRRKKRELEDRLEESAEIIAAKNKEIKGLRERVAALEDVVTKYRNNADRLHERVQELQSLDRLMREKPHRSTHSES